jgi:hypothetical protein
MNDELRADLTKDLQKSGFYSEMVAIRACVAAKWECHGGVTYFDKDEKTTRECDFEAVKTLMTLREERRTAVVAARLVGQVKKSEKPWIVFKDADLRHEDDGWRNIIHVNNVQTGNRKLAQALQARSLMAMNGWKATGAREAFKRPADHSMWYSAFVTACKAAESAYDTTAEDARRRIYFELIKPIVVLDGMIIVAELDADAELVLTEVQNAAFRFEFRSEAYHRAEYYVDVVTLKGFPAYLDLITKRIEKVSHTLLDLRKRR